MDTTPIKYVGRRLTYRDGTYGTGTEWEQGQTRPVETSKALMMLKHPDVYELGEVEESQGEAMPEIEVKKDDEDQRQHAVDVINAMPRKTQVSEYAKKNFNMEIPDGKLYEMKANVVSLIDKFGLA